MQSLTFRLTNTVWVRQGMLLPEALLDAIWNTVARLWHLAPQLIRQQRALERESVEVGPDGHLERDIHIAFE